MTFDELVSLIATEPNRAGAGHVLGPPIEASVLDAWTRRHPIHPLPPDLRELLRRANGIHL